MTIDQKLIQKLRDAKNLRTAIVCIGNTLKADDAAAILVCEQIKDKVTCDVIDAGTVPENYIQKIISKKPQLLLVIDAIDFNTPPGTIKLFEPDQLDNTIISTHVLSPRVFANMIFSEIDVKILFVGIQPQNIQLGTPVCRQVTNAVNQLADYLIAIFGAPNS